ncbi:MAG: flagellar FliJ family protein [Betaproteobacteria bacterium]|nr:flagellar FliJ family protein [Betaproteobacteria bacterium]
MMKNDKTALEKLHSQALDAGQRQAAELAQTQDQYRAALRLLNELQGHVINYQQRQHSMSVGSVAWGESRAMHSFIATLKAATAAQRAEVNRLQALLDEQTKAWTATRQRTKALETLLAKRRTKALATQRAREQAELDDWLLHQTSQRAA